MYNISSEVLGATDKQTCNTSQMHACTVEASHTLQCQLLRHGVHMSWEVFQQRGWEEAEVVVPVRPLSSPSRVNCVHLSRHLVVRTQPRTARQSDSRILKISGKIHWISETMFLQRIPYPIIISLLAEVVIGLFLRSTLISDDLREYFGRSIHNSHIREAVLDN
jgi:hypothetical protein